LDEILKSKAFAGSRRSSQFLQYVVAETLTGAGSQIKERNIAIDVFSKSEDFDPQSESLVRVGAAEVRRRLAAAYAAGLNGQVRIELPTGSYQPHFRFVEQVAIRAAPPVEVQRFAGLAGKLRVGAAVALVISGLGWWGASRFASPRAEPSKLDLLWRPFSEQASPVLICLPAPTVLEVKHPERWLPLRLGAQIPTSELIVKQNYFVGVGAALGAAHFAEQLSLRHQPFFLKFGGDANFSDLARSPAILLGAFSSPLTMEMTKSLRFRFESHEEERKIVDSRDVSRVWEVRVEPQAESSEGYALVCRLLQSDSGHPLLIVAGISAHDTEAAVSFVSNAKYFDSFARVAPKDWTNKNIELVLHSVVHGDVPMSPQVVASYVW
jgi:hypothetical protein